MYVYAENLISNAKVLHFAISALQITSFFRVVMKKKRIVNIKAEQCVYLCGFYSIINKNDSI